MLRKVALFVAFFCALILMTKLVGDFAMARGSNLSPLRSRGVDPSRDERQRKWEKEHDAVMDRGEADPDDMTLERDLDALRDKYETHSLKWKIPKLKLPKWQ